MTIELFLPSPEATDRLGRELAGILGACDTLLLSGPVGAGKSHLARALIQDVARRGTGQIPDVPSPTYTLVQTYGTGAFEIVHADLYRLADPEDVEELGLTDAFGQALCLVEWPDRLGQATPPEALALSLSPDGDGRRAYLSWAAPGSRWPARLAPLEQLQEAP